MRWESAGPIKMTLSDELRAAVWEAAKISQSDLEANPIQEVAKLAMSRVQDLSAQETKGLNCTVYGVI